MAIDQVLKKNFWIAVLPLVAIAALLNAQAVSQLIGIGLMPDDKQLAVTAAPSRGVPVASSTVRTPSAEPVLARNPFDHVTGPLKPPPVDDTVASAASSVSLENQDPWTAPVCDGVKVLVIAASGDPEWSFAAMNGTGEPKTVLRRRGGDIGGKKVHFIGWDRVWFNNSGALCQAAVWKAGDAPVAAKPAEAVTVPPPSGGSGKGVDPAIAKGIQKVSANEFNVDRAVVDKILENQADLMRQARVVPEQENGRVVGIRLFGVKPDTLLGVLGMSNGDRLQTINGFDMASPEKALEAYARLRTADKLTVQINRGGQNMNLDYNIK
jgi:general secretion pathway protein C